MLGWCDANDIQGRRDTRQCCTLPFTTWIQDFLVGKGKGRIDGQQT